MSKNLKFKDLGLLVIDEEQRFGVRHKEKLKSMRENVDVLTLSATPIPRTLQMGLTGIRDMSLLVKITLSAALILSIAVPFGAFAAGEKTKGRYKTALAANMFLFFGTMVFAAVVMFSGNAQAAEAGAQAAGSSAAGMGYLSAALSTGLSCLGGGIAVSAAASAALGAISEDSSILGKSLIFVGLAEGVCLYGLIISFMILGKL